MSALINSTSLGNMIIVTGSFLLFLVLVKRFAWEQLTAIFKDREETIAKAIDQAESSRQSAEALQVQREKELSQAKLEANHIIETAKETGKTQESKLIASAQEEVAQIKEKAQADIQQSKSDALVALQDDVATLSVQLAEKLLGDTLDAEAQRQIIDNYLTQLGD